MTSDVKLINVFVMSKVGDFIKSFGLFSPLSVISSLFGVKTPFSKIASKVTGANIGSATGSLFNKFTGSGLTGAEKEANAFTAQQAQAQMDFQKMMSDTAYQRQVADMKSAGVNPALAMGGSASGASSPSGASGSSVNPSASDFVGLLGQIANLSLLKAQKRNIDADTANKESESHLNYQKLSNLASENQLTLSKVQNMDIDTEHKRTILKYLDENQRLLLQNMSLQGDVLATEFTKNQQTIANLSNENLKILQDIVESKQRVRLMISESNLNDAQVSKIVADIKNIEEQTNNLIKSGKLTDKDIEFYEWNHSQPLVTAIPAERYSPNDKDRNKLRN